MAYQVQENGDILIGGFEKGIGASPYSGLTDMRNIDPITVPGEAPIGFATELQTAQVSGVTVSSVSGATLTLATAATGLKNGQAIRFVSVGSLSGVTVATPYWVSASSPTNAPTSVTLSSTYNTNTPVSMSGSSGGANISTYNVSSVAGVNGFPPKYFAFDGNYYWMLDGAGQVWSNVTPLGTAGTTWSYTGNRIPNAAYTSGNGLVFYQNTAGTGYLFVFHNSSIDYTKTASGNFGWLYQYDPTTGVAGGYSATPTQKLNVGVGYTGSHMALVGQDNAIYYCDGNTVGSIVPNNSAPYDPTVNTTYTWNGGGNIVTGANYYALQLPTIDVANCLAELGTNLLVGGQRNFIYPWNRTATSFSYPILLAESNIVQMQTVNTNTYIFVGNRGRIYITNGTQAQLSFKIPDHLSGTIEPYFFWGGVAFNRNELYFSAYATANGGVALTTGNNAYGGIWAVNLDTQALRLINQLSYGTYAGYASALISQTPFPSTTNNPVPSGFGLYAGWANGTPSEATLFGIDASTATPYTGGQAYVVSDMIPIGTAIEPSTFAQIEWKLSSPLLASESVEIQVASNINGTYTSLGTTSGSGSSTILSDIYPNRTDPAQWLLVKCILTGKSSSPSYNRLVQLRVKGVGVK